MPFSSPDANLLFLVCGIIALMMALQNAFSKLAIPDDPLSIQPFFSILSPPDDRNRIEAQKAHYEWLLNSQEEARARELRDAYFNFEGCRTRCDAYGMEFNRTRFMNLVRGTQDMEYYTRLWASAYGLG